MFMMCQRIGFPPISTIGFGFSTVSSLSRVPRPPASMTVFIMSPPGHVFVLHGVQYLAYGILPKIHELAESYADTASPKDSSKVSSHPSGTTQGQFTISLPILSALGHSPHLYPMVSGPSGHPITGCRNHVHVASIRLPVCLENSGSAGTGNARRS